MPILNHTTKIAASKTVGEIQQILAKAGCAKILIDYDQFREPAALTFAVPTLHQMLFFTLPAKAEGVLKAMQKNKKVPRSQCTYDQARRVAWRIIKDWCEAQLAIIEAGQAELAEVFLPYAQTKSGQTLYQKLVEGDVKLLE